MFSGVVGPVPSKVASGERIFREHRSAGRGYRLGMPDDPSADEAVDEALAAFAARANLVDDYGHNALAVYALQLRFGQPRAAVCR